MNAGRDVERLITDWFVEEAVLRAPDRILEDAGRVVDRTKQRRFGVAWRNTFMSAPLRVAAAAVVGVLLIGGTMFVLGRPNQLAGIPTPTSSAPSTTPSDTPVPSVTTTATPVISSGVVDATEFVAPFRMTFEGPIDSSQIKADVVDVFFAGGGVNAFHVEQVGSDPCHSNALQPEPLGTPEEFMDWLGTIPNTTPGPVTSVSIDGHVALERTMSVGTLDDCIDPRALHSGIVSQYGGGPGGYFIGAGEQGRWVALDANGQLVVFVAWADEGQTISEAASRAVDSVDFTQ